MKLKPLIKLFKTCCNATEKIINDIPDAIKVWSAGVVSWVLMILDFPSINEFLAPIITLVKYGTAIVLLIYMVMKTIEQGIKLYEEWKNRKS